MKVVKRDGTVQEVSLDKILVRVRGQCSGLNNVDPVAVTMPVVAGLHDGVHTAELDTLAAETAAYMSTAHPDYETLAARIAVSNLHKETSDSFFDVTTRLHSYINPKNGRPASLIAEDVYALIVAHAGEIQTKIRDDRDFEYSYFGFKTLCRSYLLRLHGKIVERPQHMLMRVALGIHKSDLNSVFHTYDLMSRRVFTHASPTMFNAGTPTPQCSSCFLLTMVDDSIEGIYETLSRCAAISKTAGGIGLNVHNVRAAGSYIAGTNGTSNGLAPMLQVFNATARYVDQGGGKRKGAFAIYIEPWHADIFDILELKKNTGGSDETRARDLFYGLWIPDLFMKRVQEKGTWSLMCPDECPGLCDVYGSEFEALYTRYEQEGRAKKTVDAQRLWFAILESQIESGTPYMLYKDACNHKSNQKNLGTIRGSNLCTEVVQFTSPEEVAVCNLASVSLPACITQDGRFDHDFLCSVIETMTRNLNRVIEINHYPVPAARLSNMRHRPIGLGVQGLADVYFILRMPFDSPQAAQLNKDIFETIYYAACKASCELARIHGPYETYAGSPASKGLLQFDLWNVQPSVNSRWNWAALKADIALYGLRNSLLVAPMPTASTSQILGNTECFEPMSSAISSRTTIAGTFTMINHHLVRELQALNLWTPELKNAIVAAGGSVQGLNVPADIKAIFKTVWEIKQRVLVDMAIDRAVYIDQSQSFNVHMADATFPKLSSLHFHAWSRGSKMSSYYIRTRPAAEAIQFTVEQVEAPVCTFEEGCISCGS